MNIIKLNAIPSTNDYLKELSVRLEIEDFTVVIADFQTKGKGQMGTHWLTEPNTNLTFSLLLNGDYLKIESIFSLNIMVANSVIYALKKFGLQHIAVKWPNDILSYNKKLCGILIENNIKSDGSIQSVVGIGINLLQKDFSGLPKATSVLECSGLVIDKIELMKTIVYSLKEKMQHFLEIVEFEWQYYHENLYKKGMAMMFEDETKHRFPGIIQKVNKNGQLEVMLENDVVASFNLKEIKMLY